MPFRRRCSVRRHESIPRSWPSSVTSSRLSRMCDPSVEAAFAHRRKTAANSIALSGLAPRTRVAEALNAMGHPMNARAEELEPREFVQLAELLA